MPDDQRLRATPLRPLRRISELVGYGLVDPDDGPTLESVAARYAVAITPDMAAAIDPMDPTDPIARQFVPNLAELDETDGEGPDPIGDEVHSPVPGIVHRYPDRVLLKPLHACPVYCRFCFRRDVVGPGGDSLDAAALDRAIAYIADRPAIFEVIVTGGDPFMLSARRLAELVGRLDRIPHLGSIRFHTRVPVVEPNRIDDALAAALETRATGLWVALHTNHPRELTPAAEAAIRRLVRAGASLVSQTVLLKGVNDDADVLEALFRRLVRLGIKPYYLHHGDLARGTAHFRTGIEAGRQIMRRLRGRLSGLAQPHYVLDIPGGFGKVPLGQDWIEGSDATGWIVTDPSGRRHPYPPKAPVGGED